MTGTDTKINRLRALMAEQGVQALLLQRASSFAWATDGASCSVNTASTFGEARLLISETGQHLIATNIEISRLEMEEGLGESWQVHSVPWHEPEDVVADLVGESSLGADGPYPGALDLSTHVARLRSKLTPEEGQRFRDLGRLCARAVDETVRSIRPGMSEREIAARLAAGAEARGVQAIVNLIATDERIYNFRHPLPTDKRLGRYGMVVLCGRRKGLVCSITRLIHFGPLPHGLRRKAEAAASVDAALIAATTPGASLGEVFRRGMAAYAEAGFPHEWQLHHQGGIAGYEPREFVATPHSREIVTAGQAFAWNPSITGVKSEDTVLTWNHGCEVLTEVEGWPALTLVVDGKELRRPAILEVT